MADFTALKTAIQDYIKQNGNEEITGEELQQILLGIVETLGEGCINNLIAALNSKEREILNFEAAVKEQIEYYKPIIINGDVVNAPDEEDLTSVERDGTSVLEFKNRSSLYGMGMVILRRDKTLTEQLTQINTIYILRYNFDLDGAVVTIPSGSMIVFDGGSIGGGKCLMNDCNIIAKTDISSSLNTFYGHYLIDGKEPNADYAITHDYGFVNVNEFLSEEDTINVAQSLVVDENYVYVFCVNNSDKSLQHPVCVLFDRNYNYIGKSLFTTNSHANDATIIDNNIYLATCITGRTEIDFVDKDTLVRNCQNNTDTTPNQVDVGMVAVCIDYDANREEVCVYGDGVCYIYDKAFNLIRQTNSLYDSVTAALKSSDYAFQGMVYEGGIATFNLWTFNLEEDADSIGTVIMIRINTINSSVIITRSISDYMYNWSESQGMCKYNNCYFGLFTAVTPTANIISRIYYDGNIKPPYAVQNGYPNWFSTNRATSIYVDNSRTDDYFPLGTKTKPYKTIDSAIVINQGIGNKLDVYLKGGTGKDYIFKDFRIRNGSTIAFYKYGDSDSRPVLKSNISVSGAKVYFNNIELMTFSGKDNIGVSQNGYLSLNKSKIIGDGTHIGITLDVSEMNNDGVEYNNLSTCIRSNNSEINIVKVSDISVVNCGNFLTTSFSSRCPALDLSVIGSNNTEYVTSYNNIIALLSNGTNVGLVRVFVPTQIEWTDNGVDYKVHRGEYYWNGSTLVSIDGINQFASPTVSYAQMSGYPKDKGIYVYNNTYSKPAFADGTKLVDGDGYDTSILRAGSTANRPTSSLPSGLSNPYNRWRRFIYHDTTLGMPIIWNGTSWLAFDGVKADVKRSGTKDERPSGADISVGFQYMQVDTINGTFPIWASAISGGNVTWVKSDGSDPDA